MNKKNAAAQELNKRSQKVRKAKYGNLGLYMSRKKAEKAEKALKNKENTEVKVINS